MVLRINEGYRALGALKSVLSYGGLGINEKIELLSIYGL